MGVAALLMRRGPVTVALAVAVLAAGCTGPTVTGHGATGAPGSSRTPSAGGPLPGTGSPSPAPVPRCSTRYAAPDPNRPRMTLDFTLAPDHSTVRGTETVVFRPDLPVTELVFRLTANTAPTVAEGNGIRVLSATADHGAGPFTVSRANAAPSSQGGLLHIPFRSALPAGTVVTAHLRFVLTLGERSFDRFGQAGPFAYFGSGEPLLAWQRGVGWHTEGMIDFPAESATSEAMAVDLTVHAPARDTVIMSGDPAEPPAGAPTAPMRTWHARIATARDVSVAAGPFRVADTTVDGVRLRVGAPTAALSRQLQPEFVRAIRQLSARFGPFPFPSLSVARLPAEGGGIEYPSSILMLNGSRLVAVHETSHQWFYAMVGDSQALHPWLDEGFATYAEALVDGDAPASAALTAPGRVDSSTESYGPNAQQYYFTTYTKAAAALFAARRAVGAAAWDKAIRCYVARNAWRIATPADLVAALRPLPAALAVLRRAGAVP